MKTVTYRAVRDAVAARMGLDAAVNLLANQKVVLAEYIASAVRVGWEFFDWPEVMKIEERMPVDGVIALNTAGLTEIGQVLDIYWADPREDARERVVGFSLDESGVIITDREWLDNGATTVWVKFKSVPPVFSSADYAAGTAYVPGDVVYYNTTGDCYLCILAGSGNLPTNTTYWTRQLLPYFLSEFVKVQAYAETLSEDGQVDKANYNFTRAEGLLIVAMDNAWLRQGQVRRWGA